MLQEYNNQKERVIHYLNNYTSIDPLESWNELGIYRLSACIHTLRQEGYKIITKHKDVTNRFGEKCNVAEYHLSANIEAQNKIDFD